jgi:hypothetical protein
MWRSLVVGAAVFGNLATVSADCTLSCEVGQTCYSQTQEALDCLDSIPFNQVSPLPFFSHLTCLIGLGEYNT